jgi:Tfp pilus assembly protein PilF
MKKTIIILSALFLAAGIFSGCNPLKKMTKNAGQVTYKTTPNPLEMHANKVAVDVSITFPPKYFGKTVQLVITPALKADNGSDEVIFKTQTIIGEKYQDNYDVISYKEGGKFTFKDTIDYKSSLRMSDLELRFQMSTQKGKSASLTTVKLADGIITTPELVMLGLAVDNGLEPGCKLGKMVEIPVNKPTVRIESKNAQLFFDLQNSKVKATELKKAEIDSIKSFIKLASANPDMVIKNIKIASYASPDGPQDLNQGLVTDRGKNSQKAFESTLIKEKFNQDMLAAFFLTETTPNEDWDGFKTLVQNSNIEDKELILRVLSTYSDPDTREKEIKNMAATYNELRKDILPQLRRSVIKLEYQGREKSNEEILNLALTNPSMLYDQELIFAATLTADLNQKQQILSAYTVAYPNDYKGWNNLAVVQAKLKNLMGAKTGFEKVLNISNDNPAALNNLGAVAIAEGEDVKAWEYLEKAEKAGCQSPALGYNFGVLLIKQAKYTEAVAKFNDASFNKALAQTLATDNESAISTLKSIGSTEYGAFYYLKAVTAAKADNQGDVFENLRMAVSKDQQLKAYAKNDLEFRKYFDMADFKAIVE